MVTSLYGYMPLVPSEIRLATIHPGQFSDDIIISLTHQIFTEGHRPSYEALSYVWGSIQTQETIAIQEGRNSKVLLATENLCCALRHLRLPLQPRRLWVDALCIDQGNLRERSKEVLRMGEIYASAEQVLVWLGPPTDDSNLAIRTIQYLGTRINLTGHFDINILPGIQVELNKFDTKTTLDPKPSKILALKSFLQRPWFSRLWVQQEAKLAQHITAMLGHSKISWEDIGKTVRILLTISVAQSVIWDSDELYRIFTLFQQREKNLFNLLQSSSKTKYFDCRDIVYANLSMSPDIKNLHINPDYEKSPAAIYQDLFFKHLQKHGILELMLLCGFPNIDSEFKLPSFIPDFSLPKPFHYHIASNAAAKSLQARNLPEADRLPVSGIFVTTVKKVKARAPLGSMTVEEILQICRDWKPEGLLDAKYCCGGTLIDAYCSTLTVHFASNGKIISESMVESIRGFLTSTWSGETSKFSNDANLGWYLQYLTRFMRGCAFFETQDGYIGLSCADLRVGDQIYVLLGGEAPFILRPQQESLILNRVVGPCYLHGIMFGEALLGPVPEPWVCEQSMNHGEWQFTNKETKKQTLQDPRLWTLQSEWEVHYCEDAHCCIGVCDEDNNYSSVGWFYNNITDEETWYDPRLTVEGLKERGVKIEEIILI